ncbi:hypothetical protein KW514_22035 [Vibrio fluvialis]|uniref:hypothetical protein n=1 Tax=Vibrio TaxID=662 RepID=UPI001C2FAA1E|nr:MULTISPECIES: hypothetical protein [Vibrio]MBY8203791.1 hypothetical protein [Vibrio fluvialis]MBY8204645.1 hypothetical protein [Vibrio fluvialis]
MSDVLSSISNAIELVHRLRSISKNISDAEFSNIVADLNMELADTKLSLAEVIDQNAKLKMELNELKNATGENLSSLIYKEFAYFDQNGDGPFCSACYESGNKKIRLSQVKGHLASFGNWKCPSCTQRYHGKI